MEFNGTAGYGTVCPVVWEEGGGNPASYPMLSGKFSAFYKNCSVIKADEAVRNSRLASCDLTARVLKQGLDVLGIEVVEQM